MAITRSLRWVALAAFALLACGEDQPGPGGDPALAALVGEWNATQLVLTSVANPGTSVDIVAMGAEFTLNIQPSGQYTAILLFSGQAGTEIGFVSVSGNTLILRRNFPSEETTTAVYQLSGNRLVMDGETDFDFNLDGSAEAATAHFDLTRG